MARKSTKIRQRRSQEEIVRAEVIKKATDIGASGVLHRPDEFSPHGVQLLNGSPVKTMSTVRRTPVIDSMYKRNQLNDEQYRRLAYYRDQAELAERSPLRSCLDNSVGGSGDITLSAAVTSAILTTARIERDLGSLMGIARAVAVDDKSLHQWCIDKYGGRERYNGKGEYVAMVPVNEHKRMQEAVMELKMAAHRIVTA